MRGVVLVLLVGLALIVTAPAVASVQLINVTSPVRAGGYASVSVTTHTIAHCSIRVHYGSRRPLVAGGLGSKGTLFGGIVQWRWKMSSTATHGRWTIDISCGTAGSLRTSFLVR